MKDFRPSLACVLLVLGQLCLYSVIEINLSVEFSTELSAVLPLIELSLQFQHERGSSAEGSQMTQFLVLSLSTDDRASLKSSIETNVAPADYFELVPNRSWLVAFNDKASDLGEKLGAKDGSYGHFFITSMNDIYGYGPKTVIDWIDGHASSAK